MLRYLCTPSCTQAASSLSCWNSVPGCSRPRLLFFSTVFHLVCLGGSGISSPANFSALKQGRGSLSVPPLSASSLSLPQHSIGICFSDRSSLLTFFTSESRCLACPSCTSNFFHFSLLVLFSPACCRLR